jgi:hypothetical protein
MKSLSHQFEVMSINTDMYHFIIGADLIPLIFPAGIPLDYVNRVARLSSDLQLTAAYIDDGDPDVIQLPTGVPPDIALCGAQVQIFDKFVKDLGPVRAKSLTNLSNFFEPEVKICQSGETLPASHVIAGLSELHTQVDDLGAGAVPQDEEPARAAVFTSPELEAQYAVMRQRILSDPRIVAALAHNAAITGFCILPDSVIQLDVDPAKRSSLYRKQYKIPQSLFSLADAIIMRWLNEGRIKLAPPNCPYNSPLTFAPKKDENGYMTAVRVCLDTRLLNDALLSSDRFQIPFIRGMIEMLGACMSFGEFDLSECYLQLPLHPDSQQYTAFTWNGIQYVFVGAPFGLRPLPSLCQRLMANVIFREYGFVLPYLDNFLFGSKSWEDHHDHALLILTRLNQVNLRVKPSSVKFGQSHMKCLGHMVSINGVGIDPDKATAITNWPLPATGEQLQSFLGFCVFVSQHVRHYSDLVTPLEAVKYSKTIDWTDELVNAFNATKDALARAPFLQYPDFERPFYLATDASNTGVGGILYQPLDSDDDAITSTNIVAIYSKSLSKSQRNYPAYKKELCAIVMCLRRFHTYIWGRNDLVIYTDHKPLTYILSSAELSPALQQWLDVILDYQFVIRHRPGILNVLPDALSRAYASVYLGVWGAARPSATTAIVGSASASDTPSHCGGEGSLVTAIASNTITAAPAQVQTVIDSPPSPDPAVSLAVELEKRGKTCPPTAAARAALIEREHLLGHFGREAIFKTIYEAGYWWPNMRDDIQSCIASCDACTRYTVTKAGFHPAKFITAKLPFDHIQIDTSVHMPPSDDGMTALLVIICVFTGFIFLRPLKSNTAEETAAALWLIFSMFGLPKIIQSDNGSEFVNDVLRALVKLTGIDHRLISPYNPRCDGKVERSIGTVMLIIKKLLHGTNRHWTLFVSFAQLSFNAKISSLTASSPFALMFGRTMNAMKDYTVDPPLEISLDDWRSHQEKILSLIYPAIDDRIHIKKDSMIKALDKHRRLLASDSFPAGCIVMLIDSARENKFEPKYVGPYTVVRRARNGAYVLRDQTGDILDRHVTGDQLKLVSRKPRAKDVDPDTEVWEVDEIIEHRGNPGSYEFHTRWKTYDETTWEPASSFLDDKCISDYWKALKKKQSPPPPPPQQTSNTRRRSARC